MGEGSVNTSLMSKVCVICIPSAHPSFHSFALMNIMKIRHSQKASYRSELHFNVVGLNCSPFFAFLSVR